MIKQSWLGAGAALLLSSLPARAQAPLPGDSARVERLRQMIEDRFAERLVTELRLTDDQAGRVRTVLATFGAKRRGLERQDRQLKRQLNIEMRPGVAADESTVQRLVDGMLDARVAYVETFKDELKALSDVLNPIQRAQYVLLRDRLTQRIQEVRDQRNQKDAGRPGRRLRP